MSNGTEILLQSLKDTTQMKTELKAKFLQHLLKKKSEDQGFTLIELLVVIIIIGILSAIALPSFLNQTAKARQSEARTNVGALNRAQQAFYLENQTFSGSVSGLGVGIKDTDNYSYTSVVPSGGALTAGVINNGIAKNADLKSIVGGVFKDAANGGTTNSVLCEETTATAATTDAATAPTATGCDASTTRLK